MTSQNSTAAANQSLSSTTGWINATTTTKEYSTSTKVVTAPTTVVTSPTTVVTAPTTVAATTQYSATQNPTSYAVTQTNAPTKPGETRNKAAKASTAMPTDVTTDVPDAIPKGPTDAGLKIL